MKDKPRLIIKIDKPLTSWKIIKFEFLMLWYIRIKKKEWWLKWIQMTLIV